MSDDPGSRVPYCEGLLLRAGRLLPLAPDRLALPAGEVHVWSAPLELDLWSVSSIQRILSADEIDRAERFRFAADRRRFVIARGLLRLILGRYLAVLPEKVQLQYGPYGRPMLAKVAERTDLHFNVSHSSDLLLYAVARGRQVGIDLERIRPIPELHALVEQCFSSAERAVFWALPREEQLPAFFRCWTRKEAFLKAKGWGLSLAPDRLDVSLAPGEPARLLAVDGDPWEAACWSLCELLPAQDYVAALAVEGHGLRLSWRQWAA